MAAFSTEDIFLVTGASSGIGREIALRLNSTGASVIVSGRDMSRLEEVKRQSPFPENIFIEPKNLIEDIDSLPDWVKSLKEKYGKLKGLICSAGAIDVKPLQMLKQDAAKSLFDIDYFAPLFLAKGFADKRNNTGKGASVVFISSITAMAPEKGQTVYAGAKAALIASAKSMSRELASAGVRVNCISPGDIETPMNKTAVEKFGYTLSARYALGIGQPSDVASLAAFLVSDEARWITGQNYILDGGYL